MLFCFAAQSAESEAQIWVMIARFYQSEIVLKYRIIKEKII
jgi:hypothetical protein